MLNAFPEFRDIVRASVYDCGKPFKAIAADLDMSKSELSRRIGDNPSDPLPFPLDRLPDLIRATGDKRPIYWLIEAFLEDRESKRKRSIDQLAKLLPQIHQLVKDAK